MQGVLTEIQVAKVRVVLVYLVRAAVRPRLEGAVCVVKQQSVLGATFILVDRKGLH